MWWSVLINTATPLSGPVCPCGALCTCRWDLQQPGLTWERLQENKKQELARLNGVYLKLLDGAGVRYLEGRGTIVDPHTVEVAGKRYTVRQGCPVGHSQSHVWPSSTRGDPDGIHLLQANFNLMHCRGNHMLLKLCLHGHAASTNDWLEHSCPLQTKLFWEPLAIVPPIAD